MSLSRALSPLYSQIYNEFRIQVTPQVWDKFSQQVHSEIWPRVYVRLVGQIKRQI
jgi:hypothetical protein